MLKFILKMDQINKNRKIITKHHMKISNDPIIEKHIPDYAKYSIINAGEIKGNKYIEVLFDKKSFTANPVGKPLRFGKVKACMILDSMDIIKDFITDENKLLEINGKIDRGSPKGNFHFSIEKNVETAFGKSFVCLSFYREYKDQEDRQIGFGKEKAKALYVLEDKIKSYFKL